MPTISCLTLGDICIDYKLETSTDTQSAGGVALPGATTDTQCLSACRADPKCVGYDYDSRLRQTVRCFLHTDATNLDTKVSTAGIDQHVLIRCKTGMYVGF